MAIAESQTRLRQEQTRPLLPLVTSGYSVGGFGGTGNFTGVTPPASPPAPFTYLRRARTLDAMAVWTLQNMGAGNIAHANRRRAQLDQSIYDRLRIVNQVRSEVTEAYGFARGERNAGPNCLAATGRGRSRLPRRLSKTVRDSKSLPIEVLNSARLLVSAAAAWCEAFIGDNEAQFRLFVAMGQPPYGASRHLAQSNLPQDSARIAASRSAARRSPEAIDQSLIDHSRTSADHASDMLELRSKDAEILS